MKALLLSFGLFLFSCSLTHAQSVHDDFEGTGNISTWFPIACSINNVSNPYQDASNTSENVLEYHDTGGQYASTSFNIDGNFQLSDSATFSLKIYVPSSGITGSQSNQIALKLQNNDIDQPWTTQSTITKPILLDQWQTVTFDFSSNDYVNSDQYSKPPVERIDFNRVEIQINGENNYDHVLAYIDDFSYASNMVVLTSNNRFEFIGLPSEQDGADVLMTMLNNNYSRIANLLGTELYEKIHIYVYPSNDALHIGMGWLDAPSWVVGSARGSDRIDIVNPYKASSHNFEQVSGIVIHEMIHCFVAGLADNVYVPVWLNEGTASYLAAETQPEFSPTFCDNINLSNGSIPTINELSNPLTFADIGGYGFSANIVEFIINRLGGTEVLADFIISKGLDYSILGFSNEQEFQNEWNQYLYVNYDCNFTGFQAAFSANETTGEGPFTVNFSDFSVYDDNSTINWSWDFDNDGTIESNLQNPTWTYEQAGNYTVKLTINEGGQTSTYIKNNYIEVLPSNNQYLFYKYFDDQSLTSGGWTTINSTGNQNWEISNEFYGYNDSYCGVISGYDGSFNDNENWLISPVFSTNNSPNLYLSFWNTSGHSGPNLELYITNNYTGDPNTTNWTEIEDVVWHDGNTYWEWTFSGVIDLSSFASSTSQIAFKYTSTNSSAATWQIDNIILSTSSTNITPNFSADITSGNSDLTVNFTDNTDKDVSSWLWDFGDGNSSTEQNPTHTYTTEGTYTVSLTVIGAEGSGVTTKTDYITVTLPTGIYDLAVENDIFIYPNPATTILNINSTKPVDITIYTIQGQKILEKKNNTQEYIDITKFNKGTYLIVLRNNNKTVTKKLILE